MLSDAKIKLNNGCEPLLSVLRVAQILAPEPCKETGILIAGGRIAALGRNLPIPADWPVKLIEADLQPRRTSVAGRCVHGNPHEAP